MCKIAPGPRCASHTRKNLRNSRLRVAQAMREVRENSRIYDEIATNPDARNSDLLAARSKMEKSLETLRSAEADREEAQQAFESTPTGQAELRTKIAEAVERGDEDERNTLQERLQHAEAVREAQMNAHRILTEGERRLSHADAETKQHLAGLQEEVDSQRAILTEAENNVRAARSELGVARQAVDAAQTNTDNALKAVKGTHEAIAARVKRAYLEAGVPESRADHYTADTMHTLQNGWHYLSQDSADRAPLYRDDFTIKVKGFEHEDNLTTAAAEDALSQDAEFSNLRSQASRAHAAYTHTLEPLTQAKSAYLEADKKMGEAAEDYSQKRESYMTAARKFDVAQATVASGMHEGEYYEVNRDRFISSAYRNQDGTTNAYVLVKHQHRPPMYLPVTQIARDRSGSYLRLNTGDKVYSTDMSARSLRLVRPQEGAQHLFNRSR